MENLILIASIGTVVGLAAGYVWKAKKQGRKCIGCPDSGTCSGHCSGNCGSCCGCGK